MNQFPVKFFRLHYIGELDAANCALASQLAEWRHRQEAGQVDDLDPNVDKNTDRDDVGKVFKELSKVNLQNMLMIIIEIILGILVVRYWLVTIENNVLILFRGLMIFPPDPCVSPL